MHAEVCEDRVLLSGHSLILSGIVGNDAFVLDYSVAGAVTATISANGGPATPLGTFSTDVILDVQGMAGSDSVRILGTSGADVFTVQGTGLTTNGAAVELSSVESAAIVGARAMIGISSTPMPHLEPSRWKQKGEAEIQLICLLLPALVLTSILILRRLKSLMQT